MSRALALLLTAAVLGLPAACCAAPRSLSALDHRPDATVDLRSAAGVALVKGQWRYSEAQVVDVAHHSPGPDLKPSGPPNRTHDVVPHAGAVGFDDSGWEVLDPAALDGRRGTGRLSFNWYRIAVTIPHRIGAFDTTGSTAVFEIVVDDYAEVWVDGRLPQVLGQTGGGLVRGYNAPNRVVIGRDLKPGQRIQLAVFGVNGPLSDPPGNFIWVRSATLDFYGPEHAGVGVSVPVEVVRLDKALDAIVPANPKLEKLAEGFQFTEGPVWHPDGYLLFSDPNDNMIYRWTPQGELFIYRPKSGYTGFDIGEYGQPGSNGLTLDREHRLTINEHGNRRVTRLEKNGVLTVLADRYQGKRLNSPNDLVYRSNGDLYVTDPPFGLPKFFDDRRKELPFSGVFRVRDGKVDLVAQDLTGPNGIAFSPDESYLYVGDWDPKRKVVMRYPVKPDGTLGAGEVFFDMTAEPGEDAIDGIKVDRLGNLYVSGPGGLWILSPEGKHLGTLRGPEHPHNLAWGDADGKTLYLAAQTGLYRMRMNTPGIRPD
jgi:gluconolactonase